MNSNHTVQTTTHKNVIETDKYEHDDVRAVESKLLHDRNPESDCRQKRRLDVTLSSSH